MTSLATLNRRGGRHDTVPPRSVAGAKAGGVLGKSRHQRAATETRLGETAYQQLLAAIYGLALAPGEWPTVLRLLSCALGCHYAAAIATTPDRDTPRSLGTVGITADEHGEFLRTWHKRNVFGSRRPAREPGAIVLGRDIMPSGELVRSAMYRRYLAPRELQEVMRLDAFCDNERSQSVSLARPWSSGSFTSEELRFARTVVPHLRHAVAVQVRIEDAKMVARSALDALDMAPAQVVLLDRRGRVVHATAAAEQLLCEADGVTASAAGLRASTPTLSARLAALIMRATGAAGELGVSGTLRLPRPSGKPDLTLVAVPLRPGMEHPDAHQPAVMLQLTDPLARAIPDQTLMADAFGLTRAEAGLAADLLCGLSVAEAATASGRSIATVRTHLASVLAKTQTARQSELVRLLMRLPLTPRR